MGSGLSLNPWYSGIDRFLIGLYAKDNKNVLILGIVELIGSEIEKECETIGICLNPWYSGIDWFTTPTPTKQAKRES